MTLKAANLIFNQNSITIKHSIRPWLLYLLCFCGYSNANEGNAPDLFAMSLEQLMDIQVSVSDHSEESLRRSAGAITILSAEEIKLSGIRVIPELLRLVPGFNVRKIDANKWAISSRRVPERFSDSLLVLKDGRTLYNPLFGGTYWELPDTILEDIKHVEVIRGPGSSAWGANAITGVINIVTKSAKNTQGGLVVAGKGSGELDNELSVRYGMMLDQDAISFYGKIRHLSEGEFKSVAHSNSDDFFPDSTRANDDSSSNQLGFRYDSDASQAMTHTASAEWNENDSKELRVINSGADISPNLIETDSFFFLYQGDYDYGTNDKLSWLAYYDYSDRSSSISDEQRKVSHIEFNNQLGFSAHEISFGAYARQIRDKTRSDSSFKLDPAARDVDIYSLFLQHKWQPSDADLSIVSGIRYEHNDDTGWEYNPTIRAAYQASPNATIWSAWTRSVRTPSRFNSDALLDFGFFQVPLAAQHLAASVTHSYEAGIRQLLTQQSSIDLSLFLDRQDDPLASATPTGTVRNKYLGAELEYTYRPSTTWQLMASFSYLDSQPDKVTNINTSNHHVWAGKLRSHAKLTDQVTWTNIVMFDKGLPTGLPNDDFKDILRIDTNVLWEVTESMEIQFSLQNLLDQTHIEAGDPTKVNSAVRRGGEVLARFTF